jgi:uncharacterized integral membrane protein (TIGR00698 family)
VVLRIGVALLGLRITFGDIHAMGIGPLLLVVFGVITTILLGVIAARVSGQGRAFGMLTGGAVAICGVSAALAISATLPKSERSERNTSFAVIGVTALSTLAMIFYPTVVHLMGFDDRHAGLFIGATIHDVAQVVGAGYSISPAAGDAATFTKLLRVTMLLPVVLSLTLIMHTQGMRDPAVKRPPLVPWFLAVFAGLIILNSLVTLPAAPKLWLQHFAQICLIAAVAALGIKTSLKDLVAMGMRPVLLMVGETVYLAVLAIVILKLL